MKTEPNHYCALCPRLHDFIAEWREKEPDWHNGPVPTWIPQTGPDSVKMLIIGLAPGLRGANRTGRPFTGDWAGDLLYGTMIKFGFAQGSYKQSPDDGLQLIDCAITNAVRCVPPQNKPVGAEINTCRQFLEPTISSFPNLKTIITLGKIAHDSTLRTLGARVAAHKFKHCEIHKLDSVNIISSYHCSRYNTNTGVLTTQMFEDVFRTAQEMLD